MNKILNIEFSDNESILFLLRNEDTRIESALYREKLRRVRVLLPKIMKKTPIDVTQLFTSMMGKTSFTARNLMWDIPGR